MSGPVVVALVLLILMLLAALAVCAWIFDTSFLPVFYYKGGPYVPSSRKMVDEMIRLAELKPSDRVLDLGSGDGRIVFAALAAGAAQGTGYEINPVLVWRSRLWSRLKKLTGRTKFVCRSMWEAPLQNVDVLFLYQLPKTMQLLGEKFSRELPRGVRIVSHAFELKDWTPLKVEGKIRLYVKQ